MAEPLDILLAQKFLPEHGGSIAWMHQVYRRWHRPVEVVTHDYYAAPPHSPEFPGTPLRPPGGDDVTDPNLKMDRRDIYLANWGLDRPGRVLRYLRMNRAVAERLRRHEGLVRVHCIHAVPEAASLAPLRWLPGRRRRLRVISYAHGEEVTACAASGQLRLLMHLAHHAVDLMIANSHNTARLLEGHIDPAKVRVVHPGVDIAEFAAAEQDGARWRAAEGLTDHVVVATIGRLDPRKNHAAVIEAVARLAPRFPALTYVVASEGRQMGALKDLAARRGVGGRVRFTGAVSNAMRTAILGGCDVFAMPAVRAGTDVEGFGMVFLEAGACGKPVLAGSAGGQAEAVRAGVTGLVVDGAKTEQVTDALARLLGDANLRRSLGAAGKAHAAQFDWPRVVQRIVELVDNLG
jgi:phosphatidylinositol alpha-1,6-mannosyltransferase